MIKRIIEVSQPAHLRMRDRQMVIERDRSEVGVIPIEDLGILILDHHSITHTQGLLSACWQNDVAVLICDQKHLPGAMLLPFESHTLQSKTIAIQIAASKPSQKRLWAAIVRAKIHAQAKTLEHAHGESSRLESYAGRVRSGDPGNVEAQAARAYWQRLFGKDFRRDRDVEGVNSFLNYGYAVMRAAVARAIVCAGLHPSIGIHHHNQYNSFCLADDLVEPLRPWVDLKSFELSQQSDTEIELNQNTKAPLLGLLAESCRIGDQSLPTMVALHRYAASVRGVLAGEAESPEIPVR